MTHISRFISLMQNRSQLVFFSLIFILVVRITSAQTSTRPTDGTTPLGIAPGTPAGSYALSGFDNVNLFNGNLNFALPLRSIGGRGSAGYTIMLSIERHWTVTHQTQVAGCFPSNGCTYNHIFNPTPAGWGASEVGFGPGILKGRKASDTPCVAGTPNAGALYDKLTRITFATPSGTEYEMIDKLTGGQVLNNSNYTCYNSTQTPSRGRVFVTADGNAATFIADATIYDTVGNYEEFYPSGYMLLRDGTRYRIRNGVVDWMLDRNGNKLTFTYDGNGRVTSIKDSMDRVVTVSYPNFTTTFDVQISFNGSGGTSRTIRISYSPLGSILKAQNPNVTTPRTYSQLFPELNGASTSTTYNPYLIASVELPNNRTYQFKYNEYGEMARVVLPTGGAYEYDYGPGRYEASPSGVVNVSAVHNLIYRRIIQKRVYKDGGSIAESLTTYSRPELYPNVSGPVQVDLFDSSGTKLLAREKHYFYNTALNSLIAYKPTGYPSWTDGREYKTETFDGAGTTVLRRVEHTWEQRAPVSWWTQGASTAPSNDPRITQTLLTIEPAGANQVAKQTFTYDQYNNKTDIYEYDFGISAPAANYTRRTHTDYLTTNAVNSAAYDTVNPDTTNPDVSATIHIRSLPTKNQVFDAGGTERARTTYEYDNYAPDPPGNTHAALIARSGITGLCDGSSQNCPNQPNFTDVNYQKRGNLTGTTSFANAASLSGPVTSFTQFDVAGNPVAIINGLLRKTTFSYADAFCNGSTCDGTFIPNTFALASGTNSPVPDPTGQYGATTALITSKVYDFWTGQVTKFTDANNQTTDAHYNDPLDRPTQLIRAAGSAVANQSTFSYDDAAGSFTTTTDLNSYGDNILKSQMLYDGLGRLIETRQYETAADYIATKHVPFVVLQDGSNWLKASQISNAFRPPNEQPVWSTTFNDSLDRLIKVKGTDNSIVATGYSGNTVMVTDQVGNKRKSVNDALGRLREVYEDPLPGVNYQTSYGYDVLDNLVSVTQGTQQRFFMYDSLKRLIRARNPEQNINGSLNLTDTVTGNSQWCMAYQYDNNGNLTQKTDARGVLTTYVYDALNRNTTIDYSDTASINPDVSRFYDGAINGKGRFWYNYAGGNFSSGSNVEHTAFDNYDALGRPTVQRQLFKLNGTWGTTYQTSRAYNLAGAVTSQTYPSGHSVSYSYDTAHRTSSFSGNLGDNTNRTYSTGILYSPFGSIVKEQFGTNTALYQKSFYNIRGQLFDTRLSSVNDTWDWNRGRLILYYSSNHQWGGSGTDNNGNVMFAETWIPPENATLDQAETLSEQSYEYDTLNRLKSVAEQRISVSSGWVWQQQFKQSYNYDQYGNRTIKTAPADTWGTGINNKQFAVDVATNRLGVPAGQSGTMSYDNTGNLITDTYSGAGARVYDAENRMTKAWGGNNQWQEYTYDANGYRTRRKIDGVETWQIYGFGGELLAEYAANGAAASPQKEYGYRNGQLLITAEAGSPAPPPPPSGPNFAAASSGATATASSTFSGAPASNTNNGDHVGTASWWADDTSNTYPDWLQVEFSGSKTINEIDVYGLQQNYGSPVEPTATLTSSYALTNFEVQYWTGSAWAVVPGGSVTGNDKVWRKFTFAPLTTSKIRVYVTSVAGDNRSQIAEVEAYGPLNVAAASNGATATASSTYSTVTPANANNGDHVGTASWWADDTSNTYPDWLQVEFSGSKTIGEIDIYGLQQNYSSPVEPTATLTSSYALTSFEVQYWTGSAWAVVPGGSVTGNDKVWRKFTFAPLTTSKIRVYVTSVAGDNRSQVVEIEAYTPSGVSGEGRVQWLVTDHLGTPRMIVDQSGALSTLKRHDYLPFGEELFAGAGGRTTTLGYASGDSVRQQFTQKERDVETGLDYFGARYHSSVQGRFTSPDPLLSSGKLTQPQSWNRYSYVINRPLKLVDPTGLDWGVTEWVEDGVLHTNYHWFDGKVGSYGGRDYRRVSFGASGHRDINADDGSVVRISNTGLIRQVIYAGPSGSGTGGDNGETLSIGAGLANSAARLLASLSVDGTANGIPIGLIAEHSFENIAGVDPDSNAYQNGQLIGQGLILAGSMALPIPRITNPEYILWTKTMAYNEFEAVLLAGGGDAIAGAGTTKVLRDAPRLAAQYGGNAADWAKVTSEAFNAADGSVIAAHAYRNIPMGKVVEVKGVIDKFPIK